MMIMMSMILIIPMIVLCKVGLEEEVIHYLMILIDHFQVEIVHQVALQRYLILIHIVLIMILNSLLYKAEMKISIKNKKYKMYKKYIVFVYSICIVFV